MPVLHNRSRQSLRVSPESTFDWKFLKVGSVIVCNLIKIFPNISTRLIAHPCLSYRADYIKGVYEVADSWYGQIIDPVYICDFSLAGLLKFNGCMVFNLPENFLRGKNAEKWKNFVNYVTVSEKALRNQTRNSNRNLIR